jgi:hypothetical protein
VDLRVRHSDADWALARCSLLVLNCD